MVRPLPSGRVRSMSIRSGRSALATEIASATVLAIDTRRPVCSKRTRSAPLTRSLSSTMSTCGTRSLLGIRDCEVESAAGSKCALDPDFPTVKLDELACDRQSKSRAMMRTRGRGVDLRELAEDQIVMFGRDSDAGITDLDQQLREIALAARRGPQPHAPTRGREVDRVAEEVADDMCHLLAIGDDGRYGRLDVDLEVEMLAGEQRLIER